jgi:uncharacterized protein YlaI
MIRDYLTEELEKRIIERFNSVDFHCIFCDNPDSLDKTNVHSEQERLNFYPPGQDMSPYKDLRTSLIVSAFLICPQCKNKFFVKILDQGKIM